MRWATEEDRNTLLLRATKIHHFEDADDDFPGKDSFRADGGNPADGVSMYNMELC